MKLFSKNLLLILVLSGCAAVKAPKTHVETAAGQIVSNMTLDELADIRPVVYYKSRTLGVEFYETEHLTPFGKMSFMTKETTSNKDTVRAYPCWFRVRASKDGKKWSEWSKLILIE